VNIIVTFNYVIIASVLSIGFFRALAPLKDYL